MPPAPATAFLHQAFCTPRGWQFVGIALSFQLTAACVVLFSLGILHEHPDSQFSFMAPIFPIGFVYLSDRVCLLPDPQGNFTKFIRAALATVAAMVAELFVGARYLSYKKGLYIILPIILVTMLPLRNFFLKYIRGDDQPAAPAQAQPVAQDPRGDDQPADPAPAQPEVEIQPVVQDPLPEAPADTTASSDSATS